RLEETLEIMHKAWQGGRFDHAGKAFKWEGLQVLPPPSQKPHPPIWAAAVKTDRSYTWAGEHNCHLMTAPFLADATKLRENVSAYWRSLEEAGHPTAGKQILANLQVCVAPTRGEALATAEACFTRTNQVRQEAIRRGTNRNGSAPSASAALARVTVQDLVHEGKLVAGTPDDCVDVLRGLNDELGVSLFLGTFHYGGMAKDKVHQSLSLFMQEVAPHIQMVTS
ncbi:MAG: LLM class flavin-dependent oxidoreductase, partial [Chloroflexota bacterium]